MSEQDPHSSHTRPRATMRHVAALAGVGVKTVSRVINGEPNVSAATTARVRAAARSLDYHLDMLAGNLRRADGRTRTLGLLVGSVDNPFAGAIHRAIEDAAIERDVAVFASSLDDDPSREQHAVEAFLRRRVDGLILTTASRSHNYLLPTLERDTPVVFVDREPTGLQVDVVTSDNADGAARATAHLLAHGHRRIAFLGDRLTIQTAAERRRGFLEELGRAGVSTFNARLRTELHDAATAEQALGELLDGEDPPTAIFSAQNLITFAALHALRARNLQHRIALVGFDDLPLADLLEPGVTVIAQDAHTIGSTAAQRIFARLDGTDLSPTTLAIPTTLIQRGTGEITP
ncbi:LacI family DNA-binding transcriptional regulator [Micromonospora sp. DT81.3]|uniref:LacI family DNA-binding transcriptional regulator n=1 Tax=Micromonospora sp. DT81.3 TaxID=3416523 RepID=UPI003CED994A